MKTVNGGRQDWISLRTWKQSTRRALMRFGGILLLVGCALEFRLGAAPATLWTPRMSAPVFAEPGGTFAAEVIAPAGLASSGWQAVIATDLGREWPCEVVAAATGRDNLDLGAKSGWKLTIRLPADVPPELFRLVVVPPGGVALIRDRAVSVVPKLESSFYIVVLTDDHLYSEHVDEWRSDEQKKSGYHSSDLVRLTARVANGAHPRFVVKLGDFATNQSVSRKFAIQEWMVPALSEFRVPTLISAGNHEYDVWSDVAKTRPAEYTYAHWELDFGPRSFVTRIGSFYVLAHEFGNAQIGPRFDPNLLERVKARYQADAADESIRFRLVAQHGLDARLGSFFPETIDAGCDLMLSGHDHKTVNRRPAPPYHRLAITTAQEWGRCVWFEFVRHTDGSWSCPQAGATYGEANTVALVNDARVGDLKLKESYRHPNDGMSDATSNACTLTNELPFRFHDGRVRFLMPRGVYAAEGGTLLAQYDFENQAGSRTAVLVRADIPARAATDASASEWSEPPLAHARGHKNGTTVVSVRRVSSPRP